VKRGLTVAGAVLVALGVLALIEALRLKDDWQGARLMPAVVGVLLVALGAAHARLAPGHDVAWPDRAGAGRVALMFAALAVYVAVLPWLGFLPATALFTLAIVRALGTWSWAKAAAWTLVIAAGSHVVFKQWLGMPLPAGPLGF
jgi:putative tricarboxylic transport membrane protein